METEDRYGRCWNLPAQELCRECGQPDNCGDCNHEELTLEQVRELGGTTRMTRKQYMDEHNRQYRENKGGMQAHRDFYAQFVNEQTVNTVSRIIGLDRLVASTDPYFNDIPMREWDSIAKFMPYNRIWKEVNDFPSEAGLVCIAKEAGRQAVEQRETHTVEQVIEALEQA